MVKRGQGSAEYLIILAVVLIVALVAIMLVGGLPAFGGDARKAESDQYWRSSARPFTIQDAAQINSTLQFSVQNVEIERLILISVNVTNGPGTQDDGIGTSGMTFGGGARKTLSITGLTACNAQTFDEYEWNILFIYNSSSIGGKTQTGTVPLIGKCVVT